MIIKCLHPTKSPSFNSFVLKYYKIDNVWQTTQTHLIGGDGVNYEGDFADTEALMDFLANPESMELPDKIEEVNANQLDKLVKEKTFVAVFFCKYTSI